MATIHAVGLPENTSERKAIAYFKEKLPDDYIVFHNLELPSPSGLSYEYDAILISTNAVYVIEVKGYGASITGNAREWELANGGIVKSPLPLASKKAKVLKSLLTKKNPVLENVLVQPLIVLTDSHVKVHVNDPLASWICNLNQAVEFIQSKTSLRSGVAELGPVRRKTIEAIVHDRFKPLHRQNQINDFDILETIDTTSLYTLYLAKNRLLTEERRYTLKVYSFNLYASDVERQRQREQVLRDAKALQRLEHPNIIRASLPFSWQDRYIVMPLEWVDGFSWTSLLHEANASSVDRMLDVFRQVIQGLGFAHARGVIHRNIHPGNVIVTNQNEAKLTNFDSAKLETQDIRTIASRVGRNLDERYVAPELFSDASLASVQSDVYSLGVVLYEILTGQLPYQKSRELLAKKSLPNLPSSIKPSISKDFDEIVARMCAFRAELRYTSLSDITTDLAIINGD